MKIFFLGVFIFLFSAISFAQTGLSLTDNLGFVNGNNKFAFDLFSKSKTNSSNLVFSPASVTTALALVVGGAAGETEKQLKSALHFSTTDPNIHAGFKALLTYYNTQLPNTALQLHVSNALWLKSAVKINEAYIKLSELNYGSVLFPLTTAAAVNNWGAKETNSRIKDVITEQDVAGANLLITNVIYFKGSWKENFDTLNTKINSFKTVDEGNVKVPFMNTITTVKYFENNMLQALELPYKGDSLSMIVLLPKPGNTLIELEKRLSVESLNNVQDSLQYKKVKIALPKFKLTASLNLQKSLTALGIVAAFNPSLADFSRMSPQKMYITKIIHKAFIEVNEQGSEAAAITPVAVGYTSVNTVPEFNANKPFVFIIKENRYNSILFMGHVINPKL